MMEELGVTGEVTHGNGDLVPKPDRHSQHHQECTEKLSKSENIKVDKGNGAKHDVGNFDHQITAEKLELKQAEIKNEVSQNKKFEMKKIKIGHAQLGEFLNEGVKKVHVCKLCKEKFKKKKKLKKHMILIHSIVKSNSEKINSDIILPDDKPTKQKRKDGNNLEIHEEWKSSDSSDVCTWQDNSSLKPNKRKRKMTNESSEIIEASVTTDANESSDHPPKKKRIITHNLKTYAESSQEIIEDESLDLQSGDMPVKNGPESMHEDLKDEVQQVKSSKIYTPKKTPWECKVCNKSFDKKKNLTLHMKTHSNKSTTGTPKTSPVEKELPSPKLAATQKALVCKFCFNPFQSPGDLMKHVDDVHKKEIEAEGDSEKKFVCGVCGGRFKKKWTLQNHLKTHTGEKPYECEICEAKFSRLEGKMAHMVIHTGAKPFKCSVCQAGFNQKGNLNSHMAIHSGHKPFKCSFCEAAFISRTSMKEHMMLHTGEKLLRCDICNLKFLTEVRYKKHMEVHTNGDKPYKCDICFATFVLRLSYTQHMKRNIHNGDTEFKCPYCDLELTTDKRYNNHIRKHEEPNKKHKCDECFAEFGMKAALARHKQVHTGERPYKCELCDASFAQSNSLRVHKRLHAGDTPFQCELCDLTFYTKSALSVHMKSHNITVDSSPFQVANFRFSEAIGMDLMERMKFLQEGMEGKSANDKEKKIREEIDKLIDENCKLMKKNSDRRNAESSDTETVHKKLQKQERINKSTTENWTESLEREIKNSNKDEEITLYFEENTVDLIIKDNCKIIAKHEQTCKSTSKTDNLSPNNEIKKSLVSAEKDTLTKQIVSPNKSRKDFSIDSLIMRKMKITEVESVKSLYSTEMDRLSESLR